MAAQAVFVAFFGLVALWFGVAVFRTTSMVRSALSLLASMAAIGALFLAMETEFLGVLQLMMMATEMAIMAIFMVMYMMDPGGLEAMDMTHQKRASAVVGVTGGVAAVALALFGGWGPVTVHAPAATAQVFDLGIELMGRSMLLFETAGVTILVAMIAATTVAIARGRERRR
jgi:NADH-quinone oxidoreductase subunit J